MSSSSSYRVPPHPYGVLPGGNMIFAPVHKQHIRRFSLGPHLSVLTCEALLCVLQYLPATSLSRASMSSRVLYVYAHTNDLWRDLTLTTWENRPVEYRGNSWKETYVQTHLKTTIAKTIAASKTEAKEVEENCSYTHNRVHVPMKMDGVYSNLLHRSWSCHSCDLDKACAGIFSPEHEDIARKEAFTELNMEQFVEQFERPNVPVIITNGVSTWPALSSWSPETLSSFSSSSSSLSSSSSSTTTPVYRATSATAAASASFTLAEYFHYASQAQEEAPLYLFERDFVAKLGPERAGDYHVPSFFQGEHTDLFRVLGEEARPDHKWLIAGPKRSGSIFHIDPNQTNAWNVSLRGRKKWIFYPKHVHPPGVVSSSDGADVTVPISTGEWLLSFWKQHLECRKHPHIASRPLEAILHPGEIIFVPHGYWHMVVNLDDCIALTHNYVSTSNLADCLRFLKHTPDQISGIRDRIEAAVTTTAAAAAAAAAAGCATESSLGEEEEASTSSNNIMISPEQLYETFVQKLQGTLPKPVLSAAVQQAAFAIEKNNNKKKKKKDKKHHMSTSETVAVEPFAFAFSFSSSSSEDTAAASSSSTSL